LIESEPDNSSSSASSGYADGFFLTEKSCPAKIPLSTSLLVEKLPSHQRQHLSNAIKKQENANVVNTSHIEPSRSTNQPSVALSDIPKDKECRTISPDVPATKISVRLQSIGSTPAVRPKVFKVTSTQTVSVIVKFILKQLKLNHESIHLYIHNSFQINPDEILADLYAMYKVNQELIISYCNTVAFG
jgi:ubiquitin-like protein ATG12